LENKKRFKNVKKTFQHVWADLQSAVAEVHDDRAVRAEPFLHEDGRRVACRRGSVHVRRRRLLESDVAAARRQMGVHVLGEVEKQRHFLLVFRRSRLRAERQRAVAQVVVLDRTATTTTTTTTSCYGSGRDRPHRLAMRFLLNDNVRWLRSLYWTVLYNNNDPTSAWIDTNQSINQSLSINYEFLELSK